MAWTDGLDEATLGHAILNGWKTEGNPEEIARAAVTAHLQTQKLLGAPAGEFVRSTDSDALYKALGAPADPQEYKFDGIKFKDGSVLDDAVVGNLRDLASKLHLSPAAATELAQNFTRWADEVEEGDSGDTAVQRANDEIELRRSWGAHHDLFKGNAERAAALLGLTPDDIEHLAGTKLGYVGTYQKLRELADRVGESKFHTGDGANSGLKPLTREEAVAERNKLMNDPAFQKEFHTRANQDKLMQLNRIIVGMPA